MRLFLLFLLIFGCHSVFADTSDPNRLLKCKQKCVEDARNKQAWLKVDARELTGIESLNFEIDQCSISCTTSTKIMEKSKSKEWDPNNPVVQRCFAESGVSDKNISLNNYVTNNCIMRGLAEERQTAGEVPLPTPRPETSGTTPQLRCDRDILSRLESACMGAKEAAFTSCSESQIPAVEAPSQINGQHAACQQTASYNAQLSDSLGQYISQCQGAKSRCSSSCLEYSRAVSEYGSGCSSQLTGSFHSTASAMSDMCNGMGSKLSLVQSQKDAADQAKASAQQDCQQQVAASSNPTQNEEGGGNNGNTLRTPSTAVGNGPHLNGINTSGHIGADFSQYAGGVHRGSSDNGASEQGDSAIDTSGKKPESSMDPASSESMMLASLPTRQDLTEMDNADEGKGKNSPDGKVTAAAEGGGSAMNGSGGSRFQFKMPFGQSNLKDKNGLPIEGVRGTASMADETPDLKSFLPAMGGMKASGFDGHGPHTNLFRKISERYKLIEPSLFQDFP
ncbi:MAG: hypothetical protein KF789_13275 [Bdellovibrionaceae bacterium]|nr:hypothetical protein [Pseudobdellovibrionaceae bacterium]